MNGLGNLINSGIPQEKAELGAHIQIAMAGHMTAKTLCNNLLSQVCVWWYWFYPAFNTFHGKLLWRACPDGKCSKDSKALVWSVCTGALKAMFDEFCTMTVSAVGAHLAPSTSKHTGLYLHATLQLHRLMDEFVENQFHQTHTWERRLLHKVFAVMCPARAI